MDEDEKRRKKAAKAAKLKQAREKAKQWAQEQKSGKKQTKPATVKAPEATMIATVVADEEMSAITSHTVKSIKRKRATQSSDDDSTGPYGTPKVRKPTRKKKVPSRPSPVKVKSSQDAEDADSDVEMDAFSSTPLPATASAAKVSKKEKLRLAREKAAKWAKEQKSPKTEPNPAKKPSRSSISAKKSTSTPAVKKSASRVKSNPASISVPTSVVYASAPVSDPTPDPELIRPPAEVVFAPAPIQNSASYEPSVTLPAQQPVTQTNISPPALPASIQAPTIQQLPPIMQRPPMQHRSIHQGVATSVPTPFTSPTPIQSKTSSPTKQKLKDAFSTIKESINKAAADAIQVVEKEEQNIPSPSPVTSNYEHVEETQTYEEDEEDETPKRSDGFLSRLTSWKSKKPDDFANDEIVEDLDVLDEADEENETMAQYNEEVLEHIQPAKPKAEEARSKPNFMLEEEPESFITKSMNIITLTCKVWIFVLLFFTGILLTFVAIDMSSVYWSQLLVTNDTSASTFSTSFAAIENSTISDPPKPEKLVAPPCFESTIQTPGQEKLEVPPQLLEEGITHCDKSSEPRPCPQGGICFGGYLQTCFPGKIVEINSAHNACDLTAKGEETLILVKNKLIDMSLQEICGCGKFGSDAFCSVEKGDLVNVDTKENSDLGSSMFFDVDSFCDSLDISKRTLIALGNHWPENDIVYDRTSRPTASSGIIGLTSEYIQKKLPISTSCYLGIFFSSLFSFLFSTLFSTFLASFNFCLSCLLTYPIPTLSTMFAIWLVHALQSRRKRTQELRKATREIREKAYEKLRLRGAEKYGEQHLRDDIAHELYPDSLKLRKKFMAEVWPRVVVEVRCDSRVTRSFKSGMEWWEWADRGLEMTTAR